MYSLASEMESYEDDGTVYYTTPDEAPEPGVDITYGDVVVGMKVMLKRKIATLVTEVAVKETKRGAKITVIGKDGDGEEVKESKPAARTLRQLADVDGNAVGAVAKKSKKGGGAAKQSSAADDDVEIASADSGASLTYPIRAGEVKKGGYVLLKEKPCKVISITTSKTGKHGHAKATITGVCIFTSAKCIDICPTSHNMTAPNIGRAEFELTDLDRDGAMTLMDGGGGMKSDLSLPRGQDGEQNAVAEEIKTMYAQKEADASDTLQVWVMVVNAMGKEAAVAVRVSSERT